MNKKEVGDIRQFYKYLLGTGFKKEYVAKTVNGLRAFKQEYPNDPPRAYDLENGSAYSDFVIGGYLVDIGPDDYDKPNRFLYREAGMSGDDGVFNEWLPETPNEYYIIDIDKNEIATARYGVVTMAELKEIERR